MKKKTVIALLALLAISIPALAARVGVVTTFPDGRTSATCVNVEDGATAQDALRATGMHTEWFDFGGDLGEFLSGIEDVGCPGSDAFCQCQPPFDCCLTWQFSYLKPGNSEWTHSMVGYPFYTVEDGDVIGNSWGSTAAPPIKKFSELKGLCPKTKTTRSPKFYGMHTCDPPTVDVISPEEGDTFDNRRVAIEAEGSHTMRAIKAVVNGVERLLCSHCKLAMKEIIARTGANSLQVQVEDYAGRTAISGIINFLVS
jgi:hypothetical protein